MNPSSTASRQVLSMRGEAGCRDAGEPRRCVRTHNRRYLTAANFLLLLVFPAMLLPGCMVCLNAKRTILGEPSDFSWRLDRKRSLQVYRSWADQAWCEHCSSNCGQFVSSAFEAGFKDGFVDYVYAGGSGEPPAVPPRQYWNVGFRNPNGHTNADEWFAGFRSGAQLARNGGYRARAIVPSSVFLLPDQACWEDQACLGFSEGVPPQKHGTLPEHVPLGPLESPAGKGEAEPLRLPEPVPQDDAPRRSEPSEGLPRPQPTQVDSASFHKDARRLDRRLPRRPSWEMEDFLDATPARWSR